MQSSMRITSAIFQQCLYRMSIQLLRISIQKIFYLEEKKIPQESFNTRVKCNNNKWNSIPLLLFELHCPFFSHFYICENIYGTQKFVLHKEMGKSSKRLLKILHWNNSKKECSFSFFENKTIQSMLTKSQNCKEQFSEGSTTMATIVLTFHNLIRLSLQLASFELVLFYQSLILRYFIKLFFELFGPSLSLSLCLPNTAQAWEKQWWSIKLFPLGQQYQHQKDNGQ